MDHTMQDAPAVSARTAAPLDGSALAARVRAAALLAATLHLQAVAGKGRPVACLRGTPRRHAGADGHADAEYSVSLAPDEAPVENRSPAPEAAA